jgi:hypothetical protein
VSKLKRYVAGEAIQLRDDYAAFRGLGRSQGSCKLRAAVKRVGALAGFGLDVLCEDGDAFRFGEPGDGRPLSFDPEARALLPLCRNPQIGDRAVHFQTANHRLRFV